MGCSSVAFPSSRSMRKFGYPPGNADRALAADGYDVTVLAHIATTLWLCFVVTRDVLRPERDPVRAADADGVEADDPGGGVLDGAPDAWRLVRT